MLAVFFDIIYTFDQPFTLIFVFNIVYFWLNILGVRQARPITFLAPSPALFAKQSCFQTSRNSPNATNVL
jgi:hypothetical protein